MKDLADFQAEVIARGYTYDFAIDLRSATADITNELHIVDFVTFDNGTDPGVPWLKSPIRQILIVEGGELSQRFNRRPGAFFC